MSIPVLNADQKEASEYTLKSQKAVAEDLDLSIENCYTEELDRASANCILPLKNLVIKNDEGKMRCPLPSIRVCGSTEKETRTPAYLKC